MAVEKKPRNIMPCRDPKERAKDFKEVSLGYDLKTAKAEAMRCLQCKNPLCRNGCPVSVRIPEFLHAVANGEIEKAGGIINTTNSLPAVCGRVCPQEEQCEKMCVRGKMDAPVAIGNVERFVGDYMLKNADRPKSTAEKSDKRVAVVGSGPSSLTCAASLAALGAKVTVYEAFHKAGGVLVYGIPEFRLPKNLVESEINNLASAGVEIKTNTVIGKTLTMDELIEGCDAVFVGSGAGLPVFLGIDGEGLNGVVSANEYLTRVNLMKAYEKDSITPVYRGKNVCVIGAGNVAMDAARTALRLGAETVTVVYRRGREEMPARKEEIFHAEEEGVKFELLTAPIRLSGDERRRVTSLVCERMTLGEADASGRRRPVRVENSEFEIKTDLVIVALGTSPNPLIKDSFDRLEVNERGAIIVDENMQTNVDKVYAGGDAVTGAATVILAMGAGRKAAAAIASRLGLN